MKKTLLSLFLAFIIGSVSAQNFTGQWKGEFIDKSTSFTGWGGDRCEYVLEIECRGSKITGYSYTYFSDGGKRYYTICKLTGTLNKGSKYVEVTETERTKTNVPINIRNCFQVHKLTFFQQGDEQTLEGTWVPAPNQVGDCGFGSTVLTRRLLQKNSALYNTGSNPTAKVNKPKKDVAAEKSKPKTVTAPPVVKTNPPVKTETQVLQSPGNKNNDQENSETLKPRVENPDRVELKKDPVERKQIDSRFEKRNSDLIKTIEIDNETFNVDLYDNGDIDGDSISLFFNGKLVLSHKRLSDKAIRLTLNIDKNADMNELIMYAENLGTIPPNTALMVVTDGDNRYEVRISSDLKKSGVIRFVHKPKKGQ